jgi:K+-transporting ATPase ATPase A chain
MIGHFISGNSLLQIALYFFILLSLVKPLGSYMERVYSGKPVLLTIILGPLEQFCYKRARIEAHKEMTWSQYARVLVTFSFSGWLLLFLILKFQAYLPLNPENFPNVSDSLAFNIASSFITNTDWQSYIPEQTLSYFSQMIGLTVQNFISASMGMAVCVAFIRGLKRQNSKTIGNFWVDLIRGTLYILLPLSLVLAIMLGSQGVIQNCKAYTNYSFVEIVKDDENKISSYKIPGGPCASQVAIKQLGTNGGGFFNANAAHPFENPTPLSNLLQMLSILLLPAALCYTFGTMIKDKNQGWALLTTMMLVLLPLFFICFYQEQQGSSFLYSLNIENTNTLMQSGGNMEGKEVRFGITNSVLWATATTSSSNGSVNAMYDSFMPLGGLVLFILMQTGEVIFGGVGSGLYGMLITVLISVFIAGLMIGRTPEYLGKKIDSFDIKMASLFVLLPSMMTLLGTALACLVPSARSAILNPGPHGLSELLYAFTSCAQNNGSAFAGLSSNTPFFNTVLGLIILLGRFWPIVVVLAIAGNFAQKSNVPNSLGTLSTHTPLFVIFLMSIIFMTGVLSFAPVLILGPILEYFKMSFIL